MTRAYLPNFMIRAFFKRVKIHPDSTLEQCRVLRDDAQPRPQIMKPNCRNVDVVDDNFSS
jgi:hypothetical protein